MWINKLIGFVHFSSTKSRRYGMRVGKMSWNVKIIVFFYGERFALLKSTKVASLCFSGSNVLNKAFCICFHVFVRTDVLVCRLLIFMTSNIYTRIKPTKIRAREKLSKRWIFINTHALYYSYPLTTHPNKSKIVLATRVATAKQKSPSFQTARIEFQKPKTNLTSPSPQSMRYAFSKRKNSLNLIEPAAKINNWSFALSPSRPQKKRYEQKN